MFDILETIRALRRDPSKIDELTPPQLVAVLNHVKAAAVELGAIGPRVPEDPATFAEKFSIGTRTPWLRAPHLELLTGKLLELSARKINKLIVEMPPRHGKALSHQTLVPTPDGLRQHGDLAVGDLVYGPDGNPTEVIATGTTVLAKYQVTLENGEQIYAHGNHEWKLYDRSSAEWGIFTTEDLARYTVWSGDRARFQLPVQPRQINGAKELPVDPYTLGVWLGDGTRGTATICGSADDLARIIKLIPYEPGSHWVHKTTGVHYQSYKKLVDKLRLAGVLDVKIIPSVYQTGSVEQRLQLLAGLVDTDGSVDSTGRVRFISSSRTLAESVKLLVSGLGYRTGLYCRKVPVRDRAIKDRLICYEVAWTPHDGLGQGSALERKVRPRYRNPRRLGIRSVQHVEGVEAKCIQVANADGLYLVTRSCVPTHNSEFASYWFPLWYLAKYPQARVVIASYSHDFAETFGRRLRDFVRDRGEEIGIKLDPSTTAAYRWNLTSGGSLHTVGRGGPLTGKGADLLIIDDPIKDDLEASSETIRQRLWDWWETTASTRLEPGAICVLIQTRWHFDDLAGRIERGVDASEWHHVRLPAIAEGDEDPIGRKEGEALWPFRYPIDVLAKTKERLTPYHWSALYQQNPVPSTGGLFRMDWWRYYEVAPAEFDVIIQSWDLSFKDLKKSSYTVGQLWGRRGAQFYLLDQIRAHMNARDVLAAIRAFSEKYPKARAKLIEDKANGPAVISMLQHELGGIIPIQVKASKESRAQAVVPYVQAGNVYLPQNAPWLSDTLLELSQFPLGSHDDIVDALTQALNYLAPEGWASVEMAHRDAMGLDGSIGATPLRSQQQGFWRAIQREQKQTERQRAMETRGEAFRTGRTWNA